uniref:Cytochrome b5 heme-binding domain-containing protein n=1 Tax=Heliothis virescens TaxID=7102 RepID=A0A2A4IU75_HELVI
MGDVKQYTLAEVRARRGTNGQPLWIVYKDGVYDVTNYIDEHPGGAETILEEAGQDATSAFEDIGHSSDARAVLQKYKIGEIVEEEKRFDANGKKKKKVVAVKPDDKPTSRSCLGVITCGLLG